MSKHRIVASILFHSPALEIKRRARAQVGMQPWKIICYQRVTMPQNLPYPIFPSTYVTPTTFRKHMEYLTRSCRIIALEELGRNLLEGKEIPEKTIAITFDNGWKDNYEFAFPILRTLKIPATVFLATSFIDTMNLFWTDKVIAAMLLLEKAGVKFPDLPGVDPTLLPQGVPTTNNLAYSMTRIFSVIEYLKKTTPEERSQCLAYLGLGLEQIGGLPTERVFLSWSEVQEMAKGGITFASNGHTHSRLKEMTRDQLQEDLRLSFWAIEQAGVKPTRAYSFPEGEISKEGRDVLAEEGVPIAVALGHFPLPQSLSKKQALILGRVPMFESVAYAKELFACRLWGVSAFGETY